MNYQEINSTIETDGQKQQQYHPRKGLDTNLLAMFAAVEKNDSLFNCCFVLLSDRMAPLEYAPHIIPEQTTFNRYVRIPVNPEKTRTLRDRSNLLKTITGIKPTHRKYRSWNENKYRSETKKSEPVVDIKEVRVSFDYKRPNVLEISFARETNQEDKFASLFPIVAEFANDLYRKLLENNYIPDEYLKI